MPKLREIIHFSVPLRTVRLVRPGPRPVEQDEGPSRERASFDRGVSEGRKARDEELARERAEMLEVHSKVIASLRQAVPQVITECEQNLVDLAMEVARRLVGEIPISPAMVEASVREALKEVEDTGGVSVLLNPEDLELVQRVNAPMLSSQVGGERIQFDSSPDVTRGGCVVQTRFGLVDARRETKMTALKQALAA